LPSGVVEQEGKEGGREGGREGNNVRRQQDMEKVRKREKSRRRTNEIK